jgi:hypothetical protein
MLKRAGVVLKRSVKIRHRRVTGITSFGEEAEISQFERTHEISFFLQIRGSPLPLVKRMGKSSRQKHAPDGESEK